jgi:hypothetical protein
MIVGNLILMNLFLAILLKNFEDKTVESDEIEDVLTEEMEGAMALKRPRGASKGVTPLALDVNDLLAPPGGPDGRAHSCSESGRSQGRRQ